MIPRAARRAASAGLLCAIAATISGVAAAQTDSTKSRPGASIERRYLDDTSRHVSGKTEPARMQLGFDDRTPTLRYGSPGAAGLVPEHLSVVDEAVRNGMEPAPTFPHYSGAVVLAARNGVIAFHESYGHAYKYANSEPTLLPEDQWVPMLNGTIFDLASVSKLFTSIAIMQLVERGLVDVDAPIATYIPEFAQNGKETITIKQLLTHTSGLPAWLPLYSDYDTPEARIQAIYAVAPENPPGSTYVYSDLGMITLGEVVEVVSSDRLDEYMDANIIRPLHLTDTGYNLPPEKIGRIAATEYQPWTGRGMIRGSVHDENAWSLGGVAGHAGVFGTAHDLAVLAQTILNGGRYGRTRILEPDTVNSMLTNFNAAFPGSDHGLGFELYQHWYMDAMATPTTAGHTGFTGTSLVLNPFDKSFVILLTNRVHPSRDWGSINPERRAVARAVGRAVPVRPVDGREAWFSNLGDDVFNTLDATLPLPAGEKELQVRLWFDTEPITDFGFVSASDDGGESWDFLNGTLRREGDEVVSDGRFSGWGERSWWSGTFDLTGFSGDVGIRFGYETDALYSGRGIYVDGIRILGPGGVLFDERRAGDHDRLIPNGWSASSN